MLKTVAVVSIVLMFSAMALAADTVPLDTRATSVQKKNPTGNPLQLKNSSVPTKKVDTPRHTATMPLSLSTQQLHDACVQKIETKMAHFRQILESLKTKKQALQEEITKIEAQSVTSNMMEIALRPMLAERRAQLKKVEEDMQEIIAELNKLQQQKANCP